MSKKSLGIIGGMGPEATVYLYNKIVKMTAAENDQGHIEILIHNNTRIPDRTRAIIYNGPSPLDELIRSASILERMGADILIISCMTSHYYIRDLQEKVTIPIIDAVKESVGFITKRYPEIKRVGILATTGTIKSGLFHDYLVKNGLEPIIVQDKCQEELIMSSIYGRDGIKAGFIGGNSRKKLLKASGLLTKYGAQILIAGCTEIPLAIGQSDLNVPMIDPMEVLAIKVIKECLGESFIINGSDIKK